MQEPTGRVGRYVFHDGSEIGRSHGPLLARLVWPAAILFAGMLWFVFSTILWTGEHVNEITGTRERAQLRSAIEQHLGELSARLESLPPVRSAIMDPAAPAGREDIRLFDARAADLREFDSVAIVAQDGSILAGLFDGKPFDEGRRYRFRQLAGPIVTKAFEGPTGLPSAGEPRNAEGTNTWMLFDGSEIYAVVTKPISWLDMADRPRSDPALIVGHKYLEKTRLQAIARFHGLGELQITRTVPDDTATFLPVKGTNGQERAYMRWTSSAKPGDIMRQQLIPLTVVGFGVAIVLFAVVAAYFHGLARDLASTHARAQELLGRDPLSGLANRLLFSERLEAELGRVRAKGGSIAVLFIDLDRFKDVNDTFGHQAGDDLIQLVAGRLTEVVRSTDLIARFGGDEFAVIQTKVRSPEDARMLAQHLLEALSRPFGLTHGQVQIGASIGIALAPEHSDGRETLMGLADTALYKAKSEGRNRYVVFQRRMDDTIRMRKLVEDDLRRAIDQDELAVHYQPLFSADGRTIVALEALVRWPHPTRGLISPADFIPVAEERGLVIPLGSWVLRRVCLDGRRWPGTRIAVNVSPLQFRHRDFVATIVRLLDETGFEPSRLELELTEGVVVEDADAAESAMVELRARGIHLALDDFGTGYSSLIYLRRFAFDTIKIDRSFLESMDVTGESAILIHSMVHLGRALGLTVTAEGVETVEQHRFLQALGCHQLQGFLFSRPVPAETIDALMAEQGARRPPVLRDAAAA